MTPSERRKSISTASAHSNRTNAAGRRRLGDNLRNHFRNGLGCRLCWKVTIAVFFAILAVEAAILFFSIDTYKTDRLAEVEREAVVVMRAILRSANVHGQIAAELPAVGKLLRDNTVLVGAQVFDQGGQLLAGFGEPPGHFEGLGESHKKTIRRHMEDELRMDVLWPAHRVQAPYRVVARISTNEINAKVRAFVWRIIGLVLMISVFVTIVTMLVLGFVILSPIQNLRDQLINAGSEIGRAHV